MNAPNSGLKNDERVLLGAKMQVRVALLEIHRLLPGGLIETVDLLSPGSEPIVLLDRKLSESVCRFSTFLAWVIPLPHCWRLSGNPVTIPEVAQLSGPEIVREIVQHLGGRTAEGEIRWWLAEYFPSFYKSLASVARLRHQQMLAGVDAKAGKAVYELQAPFAKCRARLEERGEVAPDELTDEEQSEGFVQAYVWFNLRPTDKILMPGGNLVLGRVVLGQSMWRLETLGAEKLGRLRKEFEDHLGKLVRFSGERIDDLAAQMASKIPPADLSIVPPRLLEDPIQLSVNASRFSTSPGVSREAAEGATWRATQEAYLDDHIPALGGKTPREAARDLLLRPKLIETLKQRVRRMDEMNLSSGGTLDLNWMLQELDLHEIIFDPPPFRPPPPDRNPVGVPMPETEESSEAEEYPVDPNRPPAPRLPPGPLGLADAADRLEKALNLFETFAEAEAELAASGSMLLPELDELTTDVLTDHDYAFALPFFVQTWFALVPLGCRAPEINYEDFEAAYRENFRRFMDSTKSNSPRKMESVIRKSAEPDFMIAAIGGVVEAMTKVPKEFQPSLEGTPVILAIIKTLGETLAEALRAK